MNDPAYDRGVRTDSIIDMMADLGSVILGNTNYIRAPDPIEGIAPVTHIAFKTDSPMAPADLSIASNGSSKKSVSRRSQSYNVSHSSHMMNLPEPVTRRMNPNTERIMADIDMVMEPDESDNDSISDRHHSDDDIQSEHDTHESRIRGDSPIDEPEAQPPPKQVSRRFVNRNKQ